jgi:sugar O-acyltransferase (sialic acid O-acetyltransferase NeuD family)
VKIAIFGTSGFSHEVADICAASGYKNIVLIKKPSEVIRSSKFMILDESNVNSLLDEGYKFIIGIGDNRIRKEISGRYQYLPFTNVIHPTASFGLNQRDYIEKKTGNIIAAGVRFTNEIIIGNFGIYNLNCTIGHDCFIQDHVNICPGANVSGNVTILKESFIGTNACIINGQSSTCRITIGEKTTIAAGAVVVRDVPNGATVMGVPAREVREDERLA